MKYEARERPDREKSKRKKWPLDAEEGKVRKEESVVKKTYGKTRRLQRNRAARKRRVLRRGQKKKRKTGKISGRWK